MFSPTRTHAGAYTWSTRTRTGSSGRPARSRAFESSPSRATGSSSTPHLHYERVALPNGATSVGQEESVDPGPLFACRAGFLVSFPQVAGHDSWQGLAWGEITAASEGSGCVDEPEAGAWSSVIAPVLKILGHSDGWERPIR